MILIHRLISTCLGIGYTPKGGGTVAAVVCCIAWYFAWAGGEEPGQGHYYRIQSPSFLVEFDDTQDHANHIHSVWRDLDGDFGLDLLKEHYQSSHR